MFSQQLARPARSSFTALALQASRGLSGTQQNQEPCGAPDIVEPFGVPTVRTRSDLGTLLNAPGVTPYVDGANVVDNASVDPITLQHTHTGGTCWQFVLLIARVHPIVSQAQMGGRGERVHLFFNNLYHMRGSIRACRPLSV